MWNLGLILLLLVLGICESSKLRSLNGKKIRARDVLDGYYIIDKKQTWHQAKKACENMNAKLATLATYSDAAKVAKKIPKDEHYWIGAHCESCTTTNVNEDKWTWLTGEKLPITSKWWRKVGSNQTPFDADGDAKYLALVHFTGNPVTFSNYAKSHSFKAICKSN